MSESSGHEYLSSHEISGDVLLLDLAQEAEAILAQARASNIGHAAKTLIKDGPLRVVIVGFRADAALKDHRADGPVSIQALAGNLQVSAAGESHDISPGTAVVLGPGVSHSVSAGAEGVILLTLAV